MKKIILTTVLALSCSSAFAADVSLVFQCKTNAMPATYEIYLSGRDDAPESIVAQTLSMSGKVMKSAVAAPIAPTATGMLLAAPGLNKIALNISKDTGQVSGNLTDSTGHVVGKLSCRNQN